MIVSQAIFGYLFTAAIIMVRNYNTAAITALLYLTVIMSEAWPLIFNNLFIL